jgi:hypothetical protein
MARSSKCSSNRPDTNVQDHVLRQSFSACSALPIHTNGPQPGSCGAASFDRLADFRLCTLKLTSAAVYDFRLQWRAPLLPGRRFRCRISAVQTINSIPGIVVCYWGTPCSIDLMCC